MASIYQRLSADGKLSPAMGALGTSWWQGTDGNIWANIEGYGSKNLGSFGNGVFSMGDGTLLTLNPADKINDPSVGNKNAVVGGSGSGGSGSAAFDPSFYEALLGSIDASERAQLDNIRNSYGSNINRLTSERDTAYENLANEEDKLNNQKTRGLDSLSGDLSKLWQSTNLQLGMFGAGNSSASRDLGMGVTDMANQEAGALNADYNDQLGDIGTNRVNYGKKYENEREALETKMNNEILNAQQQAENSRNDIRGQIHNKTDNPALAKQQADRVLASYQNFQAPNERLNLPEYKANGVRSGGVGGSVDIQSPNAPQNQYFSPIKHKTDDDNKF